MNWCCQIRRGGGGSSNLIYSDLIQFKVFLFDSFMNLETLKETQKCVPNPGNPGPIGTPGLVPQDWYLWNESHYSLGRMKKFWTTLVPILGYHS